MSATHDQLNLQIFSIVNSIPISHINTISDDYLMVSTDHILMVNTNSNSLTITLPKTNSVTNSQSNIKPSAGSNYQFYVNGPNPLIIRPYNENALINKKPFLIVNGTTNNVPSIANLIYSTTGNPNPPLSLSLRSSVDEYTASSSSISSYPWSGGQINGYYMWTSNFIGSSPVTQNYFTNVTSAQQGSSYSSNLVSGSGTFTYYTPSSLPLGFNSLFLFSGYSNASSALSNVSSVYTSAYNYLNSGTLSTSSGTALLGLCFGGGNDNGAWNTGSSGAVYSIYQAVTKSGVSFSYTETGTGTALSGTGTGSFNTGNNNNYNCLVFDIENFTTTCSSATDFTNLFTYIKTSSNSCFYNMLCIIIASIAHSCSQQIGSTILSALYSDTTRSYDYLSPQLYTQNVGTTNEYCANSQILWTQNSSTPIFTSSVGVNTNYQYYGNNFLLPSLNFGNLLNTAGTTNTDGFPNLYYYQSTGNDTNPPTATASGWITIPYTNDTGATQFFNSIFGTPSSSTLGGYMQWVNGSVS